MSQLAYLMSRIETREVATQFGLASCWRVWCSFFDHLDESRMLGRCVKDFKSAMLVASRAAKMTERPMEYFEETAFMVYVYALGKHWRSIAERIMRLAINNGALGTHWFAWELYETLIGRKQVA